MSQLSNVFMVSRRRYCAVPIEEVEKEAVCNLAESICYDDNNSTTSAFKAVNVKDNHIYSTDKTDTHWLSKSRHTTSPPLSILNTSITTDGHATPQSTSILLSDSKDVRKSTSNDVHPVLLLSDDDDDDNDNVNVNIKSNDDDQFITGIKCENKNKNNNRNKKTNNIIFGDRKKPSPEAKMTGRAGCNPSLCNGAKLSNNASSEDKHNLIIMSRNTKNDASKFEIPQDDSHTKTFREKIRNKISENNNNKNSEHFVDCCSNARNDTVIKLPEVLRLSTELSKDKLMNYSTQNVVESEELPLISLLATDKFQHHHHQHREQYHSSHHSHNRHSNNKSIGNSNSSNHEKKKFANTWSRREETVVDHNNGVVLGEEQKLHDKNEVTEKGVDVNGKGANNIHRPKTKFSVERCIQQTTPEGNKNNVTNVENKYTEKNAHLARSSWGASFGSYMSSITSSCLDSAISNTSSSNEQRYLSCRVSHELSQNSFEKKYKDVEKSAHGESLSTSSSLPHMHHSSMNTSLQKSNQSSIRLGAIHLDRSKITITPRSSAINLKR